MYVSPLACASAAAIRTSSASSILPRTLGGREDGHGRAPTGFHALPVFHTKAVDVSFSPGTVCFTFSFRHSSAGVEGPHLTLTGLKGRCGELPNTGRSGPFWASRSTPNHNRPADAGALQVERFRVTLNGSGGFQVGNPGLNGRPGPCLRVVRLFGGGRSSRKPDQRTARTLMWRYSANAGIKFS